MPDEIIHPISVADYRRRPEINNSLLCHIDQSPAHLQWSRAFPMPPTPAMQLGTVEDHLLFGTECKYEVSPYPDYRKSEAQEWRDDRRARGVVILTQEQNIRTQLMIRKIRAHPIASSLLANGRAQTAGFADLHVSSGVTVACKCLADWICNDRALILDLKTTDDASPEAFAKKVVSMGYDVQAAMYRRIIELATFENFRFGWIVVESEPPHEVAVYIGGADVIERGEQILQRRLALYHECLTTGVWPAYPAFTELALPAWARRRLEFANAGDL